MWAPGSAISLYVFPHQPTVLIEISWCQPQQTIANLPITHLHISADEILVGTSDLRVMNHECVCLHIAF
jgi:hypothetical protein